MHINASADSTFRARPFRPFVFQMGLTVQTHAQIAPHVNAAFGLRLRMSLERLKS